MAPMREAFIAPPPSCQRLVRHADEQVVETRRAVFLGQGLWVALQHDPAVRQEQHPVADGLHLVHVVARPQHAAVAVVDEVRDAGADVARVRRVDRGGRLVEQQQPRAVEHGLGEREPGLLAGRQHARLACAGNAEIEDVEQLLDPRRESSTA